MRKISFLLLSMCILIGVNAHAVQAKTIGVAWAGKSGMTKRVVQGFEKGMQEFAPDIKVEYQKELESIEQVAQFAAKWEKEKDGMVILRSSGAKWLGKNPPSIPTFIGGCNHPGQLGAVKNLKAPEGNITGVTYFLPVDTQFDVFQAIIPNLKSVLLLLEEGHPSSNIDREGTKSICTKMGIQYNEIICRTQEDVVNGTRKFKDKVSVIIVGTAALIMDNAKQIVEEAGKTPVVSYSSNPVKMGALGGFVADDISLGYNLAQSVTDVIKKGKAVKDVPIKVDPNPKFFVNVKTAERLGLKIPFSILQSATLIE